MEATFFHADEEVIHMYKRAQQLHKPDTAPLFTISTSDTCKASRDHERLDDAFQALFGQVHDLNLKTSTYVTRDLQPTCREAKHLGFLQDFLTSKLAKAFSLTSADHFQGFLNCSRVTVGGFGGTWHHDATSQLTAEDGTVFEYLALYYLNDNSSGTTGSNNNYTWLECQLQTLEDEPTNMIHTFCPLSTVDGQMLVLRNDFMMHRTPVLCTLLGSSERRFFYMPFRALDHKDQPVLLIPPSNVLWTPYHTDKWIEQFIQSELVKHNVCMDLNEYILYGRALLSLPWSEDQLSERPNWLFDDPDDY